MPPTTTRAVSTPYDPSLPWTLHPQVSLRPEGFGALAYHFGTRRLSFLKSKTLLAVVQSLETQASAREACLAVGVAPSEIETYDRALGTLADTGMICLRATA
jgi:putative mycofactocin binding protein MftB